jgi:hypothetical protein
MVVEYLISFYMIPAIAKVLSYDIFRNRVKITHLIRDYAAVLAQHCRHHGKI